VEVRSRRDAIRYAEELLAGGPLHGKWARKNEANPTGIRKLSAHSAARRRRRRRGDDRRRRRRRRSRRRRRRQRRQRRLSSDNARVSANNDARTKTDENYTVGL